MIFHPKDILIADWQYDARQAPVETASVFKRAGWSRKQVDFRW